MLGAPKGNRQVWQKIIQHSGQLRISTITLGEFYTWAMRSGASSKRRQALQDFCSDMVVLEVTAAVSEKFGALRAALLDTGRAAPDMDLLIAATALVHDLTLVTHNVQDFAGILGLRIQDWLDA